MGVGRTETRVGTLNKTGCLTPFSLPSSKSSNPEVSESGKRKRETQRR